MATGCNITDFFSPQKLVLDITLCGDWAGEPHNYALTCGNHGPTGLCYDDNVVGDGSNYDEAYFEVRRLPGPLLCKSSLDRLCTDQVHPLIHHRWLGTAPYTGTRWCSMEHGNRYSRQYDSYGVWDSWRFTHQ
jgi:hypothetical protein